MFTAGPNSFRVTHGFELHCDVTRKPNNLQINWSDATGTHSFHLETLTSATCSDDPTIAPMPPNAGFDTYVATGVGRLDGVSGFAISWTFTDAGEPGTKDRATISIPGAGLFVSGNLDKGNQQAHKQ